MEISVLMPIYNCSGTLEEAIQSVLAQSLTEFELIIIDDGSSDSSLEIARDVTSKDKRASVLTKKNEGIVSTLNMAIARSKGRYLARMDGDDICSPERLKTQFRFLEQHKTIAVAGSFYIELPSNRPCEMPTGVRSVKTFLRNNGNALMHSSVMMRAEVCKEFGGYRSTFPHCEDYDLWLRISEKYELDNIPEYLMRYRRNIAGVSQNNLEQQCISAWGAKRCCALRKNGFPDPALKAGEISISQLEQWGLRTDDFCRVMIEWLEWNKSNLPEGSAHCQNKSVLDRLIQKYQLIRSDFRRKTQVC